MDNSRIIQIMKKNELSILHNSVLIIGAAWLLRVLSERLHILGPVSEDDKAWYYSNCLAFMLPSLAEGFGAPVVEAMRFGKPLFLSDLTSLPEIGADVAFYFNSFDPENMQQVFSEGITEFKKNGLSKRIMKRGNEFNWENSAEKYLKIYQSL